MHGTHQSHRLKSHGTLHVTIDGADQTAHAEELQNLQGPPNRLVEQGTSMAKGSQCSSARHAGSRSAALKSMAWRLKQPPYAQSALVRMLFAANSKNMTPPEIATVRCEMRMASSCPPTTAAPCAALESAPAGQALHHEARVALGVSQHKQGMKVDNLC